MMNRTKSNGTRAVMQCATTLEDGMLKKSGEDVLQCICPYLANIHKRKAPNSNGAHYWAFGGGKNNVYEHRHCGGKAKATTNELISDYQIR